MGVGVRRMCVICVVWDGMGWDGDSCIPPVTRMTLPSRLPMSVAGLNVLPIPMLVTVSFSSGTMKP